MGFFYNPNSRGPHLELIFQKYSPKEKACMVALYNQKLNEALATPYTEQTLWEYLASLSFKHSEELRRAREVFRLAVQVEK